jgi:hypothetical protein
MKNAVQILIGSSEDWKDLLITDFEEAIKLVKSSEMKDIKLRQDDKINGGTLEWSNK